MKVNANFIKQCAGIIAGGVIFGLSAMNMGHESGLYDGANIQADFTMKALNEAYGQEKASEIRRDLNAKIGEYKNRK